MKETFSILAFLFYFNCVSAQPAIQWQKCLGGTNAEYANSIQETNEGGFIIAGNTLSNDGDVTSNHGLSDYWIVKLDGLGVLQWQKCLGGTGNDWATAIKQTTSGGYIVAGYTESHDGDVTGNHGLKDYWVVLLSDSGVIQWQKCLGGTGNDRAYSIVQTTDGGYVVAGGSESNDGDVTNNHSSVYEDYWVVKLDGLGNLQWQRCFGGTDIDEAYSIQQTSDEGLIIAGYTSSNDGDVIGNHSVLEDCWIVKLNSAGNLQ